MTGGLQADGQAVREARQHAEDETDPELRSMLLDEQASLLAQLDHLVTSELPGLLLPPSSMNALGVIMSINAGVGGGEAALFVEDLYRMYTRFAESKGWQAEVITTVEAAAGKGGGGIREVTVKYAPAPYASDESAGVWGSMRWESGVHRVQRVPATETMGRVHTSTAAVVVRFLPFHSMNQQLIVDTASLPRHPRRSLSRPERRQVGSDALKRCWRTTRQQDRIGRTPHPYPYRHNGLDARFEIAASESRVGVGGPEGQAGGEEVPGRSGAPEGEQAQSG